LSPAETIHERAETDPDRRSRRRDPPKEVLAKLGVGNGDSGYAIDQPDGIRPTVSDPDFEAQMAVARKLMKRWGNVLRELAK
jgi:hypothetical protein